MAGPAGGGAPVGGSVHLRLLAAAKLYMRLRTAGVLQEDEEALQLEERYRQKRCNRVSISKEANFERAIKNKVGAKVCHGPAQGAMRGLTPPE